MLRFLITDHLGTPVASMFLSGSRDWYGGFEPFGRDWQEGTSQDASTKGILLRLPGQWDDPLWNGATLGGDLFYNVHRWYEPQTGRYTAPDELGLGSGINLYRYSRGNPLVFADPDGRRLVPSTLCSLTQSAAITAAEATIRSVAQACTTCDDWRHLRETLDRDIEVVCVPEEVVNEVGRTDLCGGVSGGSILLTQAGFVDPKGCGCFESVLFHEAFHLAAPSASEPAILTQTRSCFPSCGQQLPRDPFSPPR